MAGSSQPSVTPLKGNFEVTGTYPQNYIYNKKIEINLERKETKELKLPASAIDPVKELWPFPVSNTQKEVCLLSTCMPRAALTQ